LNEILGEPVEHRSAVLDVGPGQDPCARPVEFRRLRLGLPQPGEHLLPLRGLRHEVVVLVRALGVEQPYRLVEDAASVDLDQFLVVLRQRGAERPLGSFPVTGSPGTARWNDLDEPGHSGMHEARVSSGGHMRLGTFRIVTMFVLLPPS
jgi:hypothetical protein